MPSVKTQLCKVLGNLLLKRELDPFMGVSKLKVIVLALYILSELKTYLAVYSEIF